MGTYHILTTQKGGMIQMFTTTLISIQTICVLTSTAFLGYKLTQNSIRLKLVKKQGKFKHYIVK